MNRVVDKILNRLITESVFEDFSIRKSDSSLIKKTKDGFYKFSLPESSLTVDLKTNLPAIQVYPILSRRFDIIFKWFEKYSFIDLKTQKGHANSYLRLFDIMDFYFYENSYHFEKQYTQLRDIVIANAIDFFEKNSTLENLYQNKIVPILNGNISLPDTGSNWIFAYLKLAWVVDKANYYKLKKIILKQIDFLMFGREFQEPGISRYYDRLDEIFADIENS